MYNVYDETNQRPDPAKEKHPSTALGLVRVTATYREYAFAARAFARLVYGHFSFAESKKKDCSEDSHSANSTLVLFLLEKKDPEISNARKDERETDSRIQDG